MRKFIRKHKVMLTYFTVMYSTILALAYLVRQVGMPDDNLAQFLIGCAMGVVAVLAGAKVSEMVR